MEPHVNASPSESTALDKIRLVSQALSEAARRTRISSRSRRSYTSSGFQGRRGASVVRWAMIVSFYLMVAAPIIGSVVYYGFIASDQYVAVADFVVGGGEPIPIDGLSALTGIPALAIVQDTQIVVNYLESRAAVERLQTMVDLKAMYSRPGIDRLSRAESDSIEQFVKYWRHMVSAAIRMPAGSVELRVRAFTPENATRIAQAVLLVCEEVINEMNERMHHDAVANAEQEMSRATAALTKASSALETARDDEKMLDAPKAAEALNKLITDTRSSLLQLQEQYFASLKLVSSTAPQSQALKARIDATQDQIADLESKLTGNQADTKLGPTLATSMTTFSKLELDKTVAERLYVGATASLEAARLVSERKMLYLNTFVLPVVPEQAEYPKRGLDMVLIALGCLAVWGTCAGLALTIRNHMA